MFAQRFLAAVCFLPLVLAGTSASPVHAQVGPDNWRTLAGGNEVLALATDPSDANVLWVGSEGGGLLRWNLRQGGFEQYLFPQTPGLLSNDVYDIAFDAAGEPWLATAEGVTHARTNGDWVTYGVDQGLIDPWQRAIVVDANGAVWAGGIEGLAVLDPGATEFVPVEAVDFEPDADAPLDGPGATPVADLVSDARGWVYVAHGRGSNTDQPALSIYDASRDGWIHIAAVGSGSSEAGPPTDKIMAMDFGPEGRLWLATWSHGVVAWDLADAWEGWRGSGGPCSNYVWAIDARRAPGGGTEVWAACGSTSAGQGVSRFDGSSWVAWDVSDGLPSDVVTAIAPAAGMVILGTNGTGDKRADGGLGEGLVPMTEKPGATGGYSIGEAFVTSPAAPWSNDITALVFEKDGTLWVGTRGAGLMRRDPGSGEWSRQTYAGSDERLAGDTISALALRTADDGTPELWVGAVGTLYSASDRAYLDGGVSVLNLSTGNWDFTLRPPTLPDRDVGSLAVGADGRVWIGFGLANGEPGASPHEGAGLIAYDPSTDSYESHRYAEGASDAITGDTVTGLAVAGANVWAVTSYNNGVGLASRRMGGGISAFDGARWFGWGGGDRGFVSYHGSGIESDKDPYITGDVRSLAVDAAGSAWAGTFELESGDLTTAWPFVDAVVNHEMDLGAIDWESWTFPGSGWVSALAEDSLGRMWAGTTRGHLAGNVALTEHSPAESRERDRAVGGAYVWDGSDWIELTPLSSGLASNAVTALAWDPTTGYMWVGTENGGLSVLQSGNAIFPTATPGGPTAVPQRTATPRPSLSPPSPTPGPSSTASAGGAGQPLVTVAVPGSDDDDDNGAVDDEPQPPSEVPEVGTWMMLLIGLAAIWGWLRFRDRPVGARERWRH
ncbi:MAG: hypothetical protein H6648_06340 [Caldilineae bacterium]|nr:hypothetical protein [Caldilineae bacterium]